MASILCAASAFLYHPSIGQIWDPSCFAAANGTYYCVFMYSQKGDGVYESGWLAASDDGVRWRDVAPIAPSLAGTQWWKGFVLQLRADPPLFVLDHGVCERPGGNDALRILTSNDLRSWAVNGTSKSDPLWYRPSRWDHMYMGRDETNGGYIGLPVSSPINGSK